MQKLFIISIPLISIALFTSIFITNRNTRNIIETNHKKTTLIHFNTEEEPPEKIKDSVPVPACNLNKLISNYKISTTISEPVRMHKYLNIKPPMKPLDKTIARNIFEESADYQKFYLLEKTANFSSFIYRHDREGFTTVNLTTIENKTCQLIDNVLLEERDIFEDEMTGTTSIQIDESSFISTFYEENVDFNDFENWQTDASAVRYEIDSTGIILEEYEDGEYLEF
ncbi:MAG: hypothetical protein ACI94Y_001487 [Maribacter sp.]|jgi:hypothetical protein